jgi:hypothetical protein
VTSSSGNFQLSCLMTSTCSPEILIPRIRLLGEMSGAIGSVKLERITIYTKLRSDRRETCNVEASLDMQHR